MIENAINEEVVEKVEPIDNLIKNASVFTVSIPSTEHSTLRLDFKQSIPHGCWLDWGDGSQRESFDKEGLIEASHNYDEPGEYEILLFGVDDGKIEFLNFGGEYGEDDGYRSMLTRLVVGSDVTVLGAYSFTDCENLESLELLSDDTDIGFFAFSHCGSLEEVNLPNKLNSIRNGVFFDCGSLKRVKLPDNLAIISINSFYGCSQLKEINLENVQKVETSAFQGCRKLNFIKLSPSAVEIEDMAFEGCTNLKAIDLGSITAIGAFTFCDCKTLSAIEIPDTVATIGDSAFRNCSFLKKIKMAGNEPPILKGISTFEGVKNFTILVPKGSKRDYVRETNWTVYADQIKEY